MREKEISWTKLTNNIIFWINKNSSKWKMKYIKLHQCKVTILNLIYQVFFYNKDFNFFTLSLNTAAFSKFSISAS